MVAAEVLLFYFNYQVNNNQVRDPMILSKCCGCFTEDQILQSTSTCSQHNEPYVFLCLNSESGCKQKPLLCHVCLESHKGHKFEIIREYFTPEFKYILKTGTSLNGYAVNRLNEHVLSDVQKMRAKLNRQIDKLESTLQHELSVLNPKYPLNDKFGIPGTEINPNNINMILDIFQRQKNHIWVPAAEKYMRSLMGEVTTMLGNLLCDLEGHIANKKYEKFTQYQSQKYIDEFVKKYEGQYDPDRHYFSFSLLQKHDNIKIHEDGRIIKYIHNSPAKPGALVENPFTRSSDTIYIKVIKIQKTALVFDAALVVLGVCVPHIAKTFGYRELFQPSHGSFMIGSNGKCYHSSLEKYIKKSDSFGFGEGDCIAIRVDFDKKEVHFSKWGFFQRRFKMPLTVREEDMENLRACAMFHGEVGAMVQIVNEEIYKLKQQEEKFQV